MGTRAPRPVEPVAYDTEDAAVYLGTNPNTMRYWRRTPGAGPKYYQMGRHVMYLRTALDEYLGELQSGAAHRNHTR